MIVLKTPLVREDFEFANLELKYLLSQRLKKENKEIEKMICSLGERGQIEAIEFYCSHISPNTNFNSKIFKNIIRIENKPIKEPRDFFALSAFFKWKTEEIMFNAGLCDPTSLVSYNRQHDMYKQGLEELSKFAKIDLIAKQYLYIAENKNKINDIEYLREISNFRNQLLFNAGSQVSQEKQNKMMNAYCSNLIEYATETELNVRMGQINKLINDFQKMYLLTSASYK